jgi:hypothetical protein
MRAGFGAALLGCVTLTFSARAAAEVTVCVDVRTKTWSKKRDSAVTDPAPTKPAEPPASIAPKAPDPQIKGAEPAGQPRPPTPKKEAEPDPREGLGWASDQDPAAPPDTQQTVSATGKTAKRRRASASSGKPGRSGERPTSSTRPRFWRA